MLEVGTAQAASDTMSFSERLSESLQVSLLGLGTVFAVLALLWGVLELFRLFFYDLPNKRKNASTEKKAPVKSESAPVAQPAQSVQSDEELVAAIVAAVAQVMDKPASSFRVVSFRKTGTR